MSKSELELLKKELLEGDKGNYSTFNVRFSGYSARQLLNEIEFLQKRGESGKVAKKARRRARKTETLCRELVETLKKAHEYISDINSFYGQGLQVYGWHFNGALEPLDNFIDSNGGCEVEEFVGRVLTKAKEVLGDE